MPRRAATEPRGSSGSCRLRPSGRAGISRLRWTPTGRTGTRGRPDAMFAAREAWQANSDNVRAGVCYAKVLALDPDHLAAEYNLALLEVRSGAYAPVIDRLQGLIARLDGEALAERWPMLDYAPYYLLAVALVYEGDD